MHGICSKHQNPSSRPMISTVSILLLLFQTPNPHTYRRPLPLSSGTGQPRPHPPPSTFPSPPIPGPTSTPGPIHPLHRQTCLSSSVPSFSPSSPSSLAFFPFPSATISPIRLSIPIDDSFANSEGGTLGVGRVVGCRWGSAGTAGGAGGFQDKLKESETNLQVRFASFVILALGLRLVSETRVLRMPHPRNHSRRCSNH